VRTNFRIAGLILASLLVLAAVAAAFVWTSTNLVNAPEVRVALVIVLGVSVLMTLLFLMAAGFRQMGLDDRQQALGLPAGTIRALIALILILLFAIIGVYLFSSVGQFSSTGPGAQDGARLAQQLLTTIATLVGAVSGFYFGTAATTQGITVANEAAQAAFGVRPLSIGTAPTLPQGRVGETYPEQRFEASGGKLPYSWTLAPGSSLPAGLELDQKTGGLSGKPVDAANFTFTVQVTDSANDLAARPFTLSVSPAAAPPPAP
jgi:hypothetical protein